MRSTMHEVTSERRRRLDARLERLRPWVGRRPRDGWIRTIRTALGMSGAELGSRIGVSQSRVSQIERGELDGTLSLAGLERAAHGLDCDLVYALVPRTGLQRAVRVQALAKAVQAVQAAGVDGQLPQEPEPADPSGPADPDGPDPVEVLADALIDRRGLWSDDPDVRPRPRHADDAGDAGDDAGPA